jgi:hypothetical protein
LNSPGSLTLLCNISQATLIAALSNRASGLAIEVITIVFIQLQLLQSMDKTNCHIQLCLTNKMLGTGVGSAPTGRILIIGGEPGSLGSG